MFTMTDLFYLFNDNSVFFNMLNIPLFPIQLLYVHHLHDLQIKFLCKL